MAKPEKPTARTRNVIATPFVCEKPTTRSRVASIPNPDADEGALTRMFCMCISSFNTRCLFK